MGFLGNVVSGFKEATKAGADFNPTLEVVMKEIEEMHQQGHLDGALFEAEQAYEQEHAQYAAKGIHTNAADSQHDVAALNHFMKALKNAVDGLEAPLQGDAEKLLDLHDKMQHILSNAFKK